MKPQVQAAAHVFVCSPKLHDTRFFSDGSANTPASVVTAVGCVGVIANLVIATVFLGEPYRRRDVFGGALVVAGVLLVVSFAPSQQVDLTAERFKWLLHQPSAFVMFTLYGFLVGAAGLEPATRSLRPPR